MSNGQGPSFDPTTQFPASPASIASDRGARHVTEPQVAPDEEETNGTKQGVSQLSEHANATSRELRLLASSLTDL